MFAAFASDPNQDVRALVARSRSAPAELLDGLASDDDYEVLRELAQNPRSSPQALDRVACGDNPRSQNPDLQQMVAANPNSSQRTLDVLAHCGVGPDVALNPAASAETLAWIADGAGLRLLCDVAENPSCGSDTIAEMGTSSHWEVRARAAMHGACPDNVLERLIGDDSKNVRGAAQHAQSLRHSSVQRPSLDR